MMTSERLDNGEILNEEPFENDLDLEQGLDTLEEEKGQPWWYRSKMFYIAAGVVGSIFLLYGIIFLFFYKFQVNFIYPKGPKATSNSYLNSSANYFGDEIQEEYNEFLRVGGWHVVDLKTEDGVDLHNLWIHANMVKTNDNSVPVTILYFHGNGDRIDNSAGRFIKIHNRINCNIFLLSYRGYGHSGGEPDEEGIKKDAQAALNWILKNVTEEEKRRIVVYGTSLGGAVAIDLVSKNNDKVSGLIVENTFLSLSTLLSDISVFLRPFTYSLHQVFDSETAIKKITAPILFLSGSDDKLIPPAHMKKLRENATKSKRTKLLEYPGLGHNDMSPNYSNDILQFLERI